MLFSYVVLWLFLKVLEEHAAFIFRVEVRRFRESMGYIRLGGRSGQEDWPRII
jgi:hypothetical protein